MVSHREDVRELSRRPSESPRPVGRRMADRPVDSEPVVLRSSGPIYVGRRAARVVVETGTIDTGAIETVLASLEPVDQTTSFAHEPTEQLPLVRGAAPAELPWAQEPADQEAEAPVAPVTESLPPGAPGAPVAATPGKRRAVKHAGRRGPLFKALPSVPVLLGVTTMAVAVVGTVSSADTDMVSGGGDAGRVSAASALGGTAGVGTVARRGQELSRDSARDALGDAAGATPSDPTESLAQQRAGALKNLAARAQVQAQKYEANRWVLPLDGYRLTARYGEYGLWSSYHTGLDFAAPSGTPIRAIANGVVTSTGYDGSYGNKTVITLEDGTEMWYCHQTAYEVSVGDQVRGGDLIGYVGSTGNSTGPHLHLEVRPGGGDPVDPYAALVQNGVVP